MSDKKVGRQAIQLVFDSTIVAYSTFFSFLIKSTNEGYMVGEMYGYRSMDRNTSQVYANKVIGQNLQ